MKIDSIFLYPVKSVGGIAVDSAQITETGSLKGDREWLVVNENGEMRWQGDIPALTLLAADYANGALGLSNKAGSGSRLRRIMAARPGLSRNMAFPFPEPTRAMRSPKPCPTGWANGCAWSGSAPKRIAGPS